jgi:hypothetical protein
MSSIYYMRIADVAAKDHAGFVFEPPRRADDARPS